jgi:hypothetical protein
MHVKGKGFRWPQKGHVFSRPQFVNAARNWNDENGTINPGCRGMLRRDLVEKSKYRAAVFPGAVSIGIKMTKAQSRVFLVRATGRIACRLRCSEDVAFG